MDNNSDNAAAKRASMPFFHRVVWQIACKGCVLGVLIPVGVAFWQSSVLMGIVTAFVLNSLLAIVFYYEDKHLASNNYWRIPELILHCWELISGWPGALFAQWTFRHKNRKLSFQLVFWLCVIVNVAVISCLVWLFYWR